MRVLTTIAALAIAATGIGASAQRERDAPPPATPDGEAVSCIQSSRIRSTDVHGDRVIDFHMTGGKVYRNELPHACPSLGFEERFSYKTSINQLCSTDIIHVLQTPPSVPGPACGLGKFQPVKIAKKPR